MPSHTSSIHLQIFWIFFEMPKSSGYFGRRLRWRLQFDWQNAKRFLSSTWLSHGQRWVITEGNPHSTRYQLLHFCQFLKADQAPGGNWTGNLSISSQRYNLKAHSKKYLDNKKIIYLKKHGSFSLILIWSTSKGWKVYSTMEPQGGFESVIFGLVIPFSTRSLQLVILLTLKLPILLS